MTIRYVCIGWLLFVCLFCSFNGISITRIFQTDLKSKISILQEKEESLKKTLDTLEKVDEIDVDEAVTTTAPLYRQYVFNNRLSIYIAISSGCLYSLNSFPDW